MGVVPCLNWSDDRAGSRDSYHLTRFLLFFSNADIDFLLLVCYFYFRQGVVFGAQQFLFLATLQYCFFLCICRSVTLWIYPFFLIFFFFFLPFLQFLGKEFPACCRNSSNCSSTQAFALCIFAVCCTPW